MTIQRVNALMRLRKFARQFALGCCRLPSLGDKCECPLCDLDVLCDVPQPNPWLERPDSVGDWRFWEPTRELMRLYQVRSHNCPEDPHLYVKYGSRVECLPKGLWQRIPDAVPPKVDA